MWETCKDLQKYIVSLRQELHQVPEVGVHLPETQAIVARELDHMGISYRKNERDSGIIGEIKGGHPGKTILLRADYDALPITEKTGVPYASRHEGCMHACGHDAHAAMLLGALQVLQKNRNSLRGSVRFVFQTGEEICKGAKNAVAEGVLKGVDAVFGCHVGCILGSELKSGTLVVVPGCCMASFDRFILKVHGVGSHGSTPEKGVDPINIASHIVLALQEILAREIAAPKPAVLTVGQIHGGFAYNAIPEDVLIEGTIRAFDDDVRQYLAKRIQEISQSTAATFRGSCDFEMDWGAPPVVNTDCMAALAGNSAKKVLGENFVLTSQPTPNMGGEDFAYYLAETPGAFMFLSTSNAEKRTNIPHHNPKFNIDEDVLYQGSAIFVAIAEDYLNS